MFFYHQTDDGIVLVAKKKIIFDHLLLGVCESKMSFLSNKQMHSYYF